MVTNCQKSPLSIHVERVASKPCGEGSGVNRSLQTRHCVRLGSLRTITASGRMSFFRALRAGSERGGLRSSHLCRAARRGSACTSSVEEWAWFWGRGGNGGGGAKSLRKAARRDERWVRARWREEGVRFGADQV